MNRSAPLAALVLLGSLAWAGDDMKHEEWFKKWRWSTDYAGARAESKKSSKLVFAYFTQPH
jgi:hypothetical protein